MTTSCRVTRSNYDRLAYIPQFALLIKCIHEAGGQQLINCRIFDRAVTMSWERREANAPVGRRHWSYLARVTLMQSFQAVLASRFKVHHGQ